MEYTIVVAATASESAAMQYVSAYSGWRWASTSATAPGRLIIYDDLSKQAVAYRQVSLLLRAVPGSQFLRAMFSPPQPPAGTRRPRERRLRRSLHQGRSQGKTGSPTALPDHRNAGRRRVRLVPTNVISITDGQIFLETSLFNAGIRPAINAGISVSRVGGAAQTKLIKGTGPAVSVPTWPSTANWPPSRSSPPTWTKRRSKQLDRGARVTELLKQAQKVVDQPDGGVSLLRGEQGLMDEGMDVKKVLTFEHGLHAYLKDKHAALLAKLENEQRDGQGTTRPS